MPSHAPHEFRYLLEAAEQVSRAPTVETGGDGWTEEDGHSTLFAQHIRRRQRNGLEDSTLTRVYNNRPHIPGEDSGSDEDEIQDHVLPEERLMPEMSPTRERQSVHDIVTTDSAGQQSSPLSVDAQDQSTEVQTRDQLPLRQRLQSYINNNTRQRDEAGASYGFERSGTPIRARRAPPRPQFAHDMEEAINRAAVFERRLERALSEYRSARRAWTTTSDPSSDSVESRTPMRNPASSNAVAPDLTNSVGSETTEFNSIHDILHAGRRELPSHENSATLSDRRQRGHGQVSSLRHHSGLRQYQMHRWQRDSDGRSRYGILDSDALLNARSSLYSDRQSRYHQPYHGQPNTDSPDLTTYQSRVSSRSQGSGRHLAQSFGQDSLSRLASGPLFDSLRASRTDTDYGLSHRNTIQASGYVASRLEAGASSQRHLLQSARKLQQRNEHKKMEKPKAILKYLTCLREDPLTHGEARELATQLGVHNYSLEQGSQSDLVMSIDELPPVEYTSWLEPGVTWQGSQYADFDREKMEPALIRNQLAVKVTLHSVNWEKMTITGTMEAQQSQQNKNTESFFTGEIVDFRNHGLDTYLSHRSKNQPRNNFDDHTPDSAYQDLEMDLTHWPMLNPFKRDINLALSKRQNELQQYRYLRNSERDSSTFEGRDMEGDVDEHLGGTEDFRFKGSWASEGVSSSPSPRLTADEVSDVKLSEIGRLLSSAQWLQNNLNKNGWILMRWKEKCFISSNGETDATGRSASHDESDRTRQSNRVWTTVESERENPTTIPDDFYQAARDTWALSISGFYYVALNRQTGEIEAMYHDPGSALYQKLEMKPSSPTGNPGVRTSFNLIEFR